MKVFYSDQYPIPLPPRHRFPARKYALLREAIAATGLVAPQDMVVSAAATDEQILLAHDGAYLERVKTGQLGLKEIRRIGLPWSPELVERARRSTGGTIDACRAALQDGVAVNLAGGTHHAFRAYGQGFCLFNDSVIAARTMRAEGRSERVVVIDCDVHQGNGTAALAADDPAMFTFSIHNEQNFPLHKVASDLDIGLNDGTGDAAYLEALESGLRRALHSSGADLAIYLAGADPYEGDLLGRLALSKVGLARRDQLVFDRCWRARVPVATVMAGGYGRNIQDTVDIHLQTVRIAAAMAKRWAVSRDRKGLDRAAAEELGP
jgi:acetoin utilization deacetylase AcuC-like enzyme